MPLRAGRHLTAWIVWHTARRSTLADLTAPQPPEERMRSARRKPDGLAERVSALRAPRAPPATRSPPGRSRTRPYNRSGQRADLRISLLQRPQLRGGAEDGRRPGDGVRGLRRAGPAGVLPGSGVTSRGPASTPPTTGARAAGAAGRLGSKDEPKRRPQPRSPTALLRILQLVLGGLRVKLRLGLTLLALIAVAGDAQARTVGRSVQGRPIEARVDGEADAPLRILVVGSIHGNETAGHAVIRRLRAARAAGRHADLDDPHRQPRRRRSPGRGATPAEST